MKKLCLLLLFIFSVFSISAQVDSTETEDLIDMSLEDLMEIEITSVSKKAENVLEAPQTITVITEAMIIQRGYTDLEQIFHDLPGFDISRGNGTQYSQIYQRGYRSKNTERTLFMIDGVEENDLWSNSVWLSRQYPLSNIKRVEVIYGPASTIYGANAFLGVINVITKSAEEITGEDKSIGVNANLAYGTWNTMYADISLAAKKNDISFTLTGRIYQSDEMDLSKYPDYDYDLTTYDLAFYRNILATETHLIIPDNIAQAAMDLDNAAYYNSTELNGITPHYSNTTNDFLINAKLKIKNFTLGFQTFRRDEGYGAWYRDDYELGPENGGKWVPINTFLYAKYEKEISEKLSLTSFTRFKAHSITGSSEEYYFQGYLNGAYGLADIADVSGAVPVLSAAQGDPYWWHAWYHTYSQQLRSELRVSYNPIEKLNIVSGIELRMSHIQGDYWVATEPMPEDNAGASSELGGNYFYSQDIGFFAQASYRAMEDLNIVLGGRVDNNKIREEGGYGTVFNPKLALVYTPSDFIIKAMYSEAFMDAGAWTKYATTAARQLNNPTLEPEEVKNTELSLGWKINENLFFDAIGYYSLYDGFVETVATTFVDETGATTTTNQHQATGSLKIMGFMSNINYKFANYTAYLNYTYTDPYNTTESEDVRIGDIASHQINFGVNALFFEKLNVNLRMNWVGEKPTGAETTISSNPNDMVEEYFVLNGAISYNIFKGLSAQVLVNNILDAEYFHPGARSANGGYYGSLFPQNERNLMFKLMYKF